jgi:hypothetical protein
MESVFVSYKFRDSDRQVADDVKRLIKSHLLTWLDGEDLFGTPLWEGVSQLVRSTNALVALFLLPQDVGEEAWVRTEYVYAIGNKKPVIAVVEDGFIWGNPENKEYVKFNRAAPLPAFLKLSATLGGWRREGGREVQLVLLPQQAAELVALSGYSCRYRLHKNNQPLTDWRPVNPGKYGEAYGFRASGILENLTIEFQVDKGILPVYRSLTDVSSIPITLKDLTQQ